MQTTLAEEAQKLAEQIPEWNDPEEGAKGRAELAEYLQNKVGFSVEELQSAADHRLIVMARKAMLYDAKPKAQEIVKKRVLKVPKVLKPGGQRSPQQSAASTIDKLSRKAQSTGSIDDAFALLKASRGSATN